MADESLQLTTEELLLYFGSKLGSSYPNSSIGGGGGSSGPIGQTVPTDYEFQNNLLKVESTWKALNNNGIFPGEDFTLRARIWDTETGLFLVRSSISTIKATTYRLSNTSINNSTWTDVADWKDVSIDPEKTFSMTTVDWKYDPNEWNFVWRPKQISKPMFSRSGSYLIQVSMTFTDNRLPLRFSQPITISR